MDGGLTTPRGGAAVGSLDELDAVEAGAVLCLRLWCQPVDAPDRAAFLADTAGSGGRAALGAIGALCELCLTYGRRPLMRHAMGCRCLGADEACVARIVEAALAGERDDAMLMAALLVRADMAPAAVALAEQAGVALARLAVTPADAPRGPLH
ncbi:hypothetical protein [Maritimibacter sp. UBA3975]|uniref:hypothetical protein n=1 Tax=Maritimibacter sp. UBA3975 TaxID=1946833 RepID=UPI000C096C60|nr:hypothetical protein [Maritimibacter sp. UBA3975]MAM62717.1 hypothetical protein [Maritimibacter sp.]